MTRQHRTVPPVPDHNFFGSPFSHSDHADTVRRGFQPSLPETSTAAHYQRSADGKASRGSTSPALRMKRALPARPEGQGVEPVRRPGLEVFPKPAGANVSHPDSVGQPHRSKFLPRWRPAAAATTGSAAAPRQPHPPPPTHRCRGVPRLPSWAWTRGSGYPGRSATFRHHARSGRGRSARHAPANVQ